jgi:toxin HigB-1
VIKSFADARTEAFYISGKSKHLPGSMRNVAKRKLFQLEYARSLTDLASPPGNHLEALRRSREGQHSIRINDQYRVCFEFRDGNAYRVEIVDYH